MNTVNGAAAYFTYTPTLYISAELMDTAGVVSFNEDVLEYSGSGKYYSQSDLSGISTRTWEVTGDSSIPYLHFTVSGDLPLFDITSTLLNDTLKKNDTLFITLSNLQDADSVTFTFFDDNQLQTQHRSIFHSPNYTNEYYIPPSVFENLSVGPRAVIKIDVINYSYQTISQKQFLFRNSYSYVQGGVKIVN